jgi:hypothetical protein
MSHVELPWPVLVFKTVHKTSDENDHNVDETSLECRKVPCEQSLLLPPPKQEKETQPKPCSFFEVTVAQNSGLLKQVLLPAKVVFVRTAQLTRETDDQTCAHEHKMAVRVRQVVTSVFHKRFASTSFSLSAHQQQAITEFITGRDTFVSLPTGHVNLSTRESLGERIDDAFQDRPFPEKPLILIVRASDIMRLCDFAELT